MRTRTQCKLGAWRVGLMLRVTGFRRCVFKYGERPAQVYFMVRNVRDLVMNQYLSFSTYPFQKGYPHCAVPAVVRIATRTT
jgi:hypothetical protein